MKQSKEYLSKETLIKAVETFQQCYAEHEAELTPITVKMAVTALGMMKQFIEITPGEDTIPIRCSICDYCKDSECLIKFGADGEPLAVGPNFYCGDANCTKG